MEMSAGKQIACVTGASGMVGSQIVSSLLEKGYGVRAISRNPRFLNQNAEVFCGGLQDEEVLRRALHGSQCLFHCAAELYDPTKMWDVNVLGTGRLLRLAKESGITYLCYLSSAGVVGNAKSSWVDETTVCNPQNMYERSKWFAEQLVACGIDRCKVVILRPTNVLDSKRPGALGLPMRGLLLDRFKVFLKGGECAHIVHAEDVAAVAVYFIDHPIESPQCYVVSCDHDKMNTFAGLWALYRAYQKGRPDQVVNPVPHLPILVPHLMRRLLRKTSNKGNVRYSSRKLLSSGFTFPLGVMGAVRKVVEHLERGNDSSNQKQSDTVII